MASSKARSRNRSGRPTRSGGARPAARTAAPKQQQGQQPKGAQTAKAPAAKAQAASAKPQAAGAQAQPRETAQGGPGRAKRQATAVAAEPIAP